MDQASEIETLTRDLYPVIGLLARLFADKGDTKAVAVLAHSEIIINNTGYDSWNDEMEMYGFTVTLEIPFHIYRQIETDQSELEELFNERSKNLLKRYPNAWIESFIITPEAPKGGEWQGQAKVWLIGEGINNQGRVRSDNIASRKCDGLLFRSQPEIHMYKALKSKGVSFAPLPVFIRGGDDYRRIEPDFVIFKEGVLIILEVDGDTVHTETPAEAHARTTMLAHEGAHIERVKSSDCDSAAKADVVANNIIELITKIKNSK